MENILDFLDEGTALYEEGYTGPKSGGGKYFRLESGKVSKIRILTAPVLFWSYFAIGENGKNIPKKFFYNDKPSNPEDIAPGKFKDDKTGKIKPQEVAEGHSFLIYDFEDKAIKVFETTTKSIIKYLFDISKDEDWGDYRQYDIKIDYNKDRPASDMYKLGPVPKKDLPEEALEGIKKVKETPEDWDLTENFYSTKTDITEEVLDGI